MSLFGELVAQAMQAEASLGTVRAAVEKELLHHDILREMSRAGLLNGLIFIGGTCLRTCYGSPRLSEDLDFAGGFGFRRSQLADLGRVLESTLMDKYGLPVRVSDPVREEGNVSTWKMRLTTRPAAKHLPAQRVHIAICAVRSHRPRPSLLRNHYGVDMGTDGLILQVESRDEILADKWVALAFRPNRVQYRDLWDILWLERQGGRLEPDLVLQKVRDRQHSRNAFADKLSRRLESLHDEVHERSFRQEMNRFLPQSDVRDAVDHPDFWTLLLLSLEEQVQTLIRS